MQAFIIFTGNNDNYIEISGLKDAISGLFLNDASVEVHVRETDGSDAPEPSGFSWPQTLDYVSDSDGIYRVTLDKAIIWVAGTRYIATITAVESGVDGEWVVDLLAKVRSS